jgi:3'(2'), 5'-bisphosphate nucleotidase
MEWDTGAAQCVLEAAGGGVFALWGGKDPASALRYNKKSLKNPPFLAVGDPAGPWREFLHGAGLA